MTEMQERPMAAILDRRGNITAYVHQYIYQDYGYPLWSQRDPKWASEMLGYNRPGTKWTIGNYGCLLTDFAMALTNHEDRKITPLLLNDQLKEIGGFTVGGGDLYFPKVTELYPTFVFKKLVRCLDVSANTQEIEAWLKAGNYCVVEIDMDLRDVDVDEHWILLTSGTADKFWCHDPWPKPADQEAFTMPPIYCKQGWTPARAIYAYVFYENREPRG